MGSLSDLNNTSAQTINYNDLRNPKVKYEQFDDLEKDFTETSLTFTIINSVEVLEVIRPSLTNFRYTIELATAAATLDFGTIPSGVTVNRLGNVYTVTGIDSVEDWDSMKNPTCTLDGDFQGDFFYDTRIIYDTDTQVDVTVRLQVGVYVPVSLFAMAATQTTNGAAVRGITKELELQTVLQVLAVRYPLVATTEIECSALVVQITGADLDAASTLTADADLIGNIEADLNPVFTQTATPVYVKTLSNSIDRDFASYQKNAIFLTDTPQVDDVVGTFTYRIELSSPNGDFGTANSATIGTYTYTGSKSQINSHFPNIYFWPDDDFTSDTTFTLKVYRDNVLYRNDTRNLTHDIIGSTGNIYTFTSSGTWTPSFEELRYCQFHAMVIGGGGGMSPIPNPQPDLSNFKGNSAGGGGDVKSINFQNLTNTTYNFTVGNGGARGQSGGTTSGFGLTAAGGSPGFDTNVSNGINGTYSTYGGASGNGNLGNIEQSWRDGGTGGGAGGAAPGGSPNNYSIGMPTAYSPPNNGNQGAGPGKRDLLISSTYYGVGGNATYSNIQGGYINTISSTSYGSGGGEDGTGFGGVGAGRTGAVIIKTVTS